MRTISLFILAAGIFSAASATSGQTDAQSLQRMVAAERAFAAASGELAVTIGAFDGTAASPDRKGSWVRVWKRDIGGRWRIVFQTENGG